MKKRSRRPSSGLVAQGAVGLSAFTGAYLLARRSGGGKPDLDAGATTTDQREEWQCECGQLLLVTGEGRHRVFWMAEAPLEDPLLGDRCPNCERDLLAQG